MRPLSLVEIGPVILEKMIFKKYQGIFLTGLMALGKSNILSLQMDGQTGYQKAHWSLKTYNFLVKFLPS